MSMKQLMTKMKIKNLFSAIMLCCSMVANSQSAITIDPAT